MKLYVINLGDKVLKMYYTQQQYTLIKLHRYVKRLTLKNKILIHFLNKIN